MAATDGRVAWLHSRKTIIFSSYRLLIFLQFVSRALLFWPRCGKKTLSLQNSLRLPMSCPVAAETPPP